MEHGRPRSYSVSSDLSHCGSPKADELIEARTSTNVKRGVRVGDGSGPWSPFFKTSCGAS